MFVDLLRGRIARLYPLHIIALASIVVTSGLGGRPFDAAASVEAALLVNNIVAFPASLPANAPSWSVSIDMLASLLLWPVMKLAHRDAAIWLLSAASLCTFAFEPSCSFGVAGPCIGPFTAAIVRGICGATLGVAAYRVASARRDLFINARYASYLALLSIVLLSLLPTPTPALQITSLILAAFAVACLASDDENLLSRRACVFLGTISFSIYLLHVPIYDMLSLFIDEKHLRGGPGKAMTITLIVIASALSYKYIELPSKRLLLKRLALVSDDGQPRCRRSSTADLA
jgi:peptidoglycan/LPS O-acetylase OafA/YrhL